MYTERLHLRELKLDDDKEIFFLRSNQEHNRFLARNIATDATEAIDFIKGRLETSDNQAIYWAISLIDEPGLIGTICLWNFKEDKITGEIGYEMMPAFQGKGLMREALTGVINYAFNVLKLLAIHAESHPNNLASKHLLEINNFSITSVKPDAIYFELTPDKFLPAGKR